MKTSFISRSIFYPVLLMTFLTFIASFSLHAQDTPAKKPKKATVTIRIKDDDGKTKVIDTTFLLADPSGHKKFEEYMKQYEGNFKSLEDNLKNMEVMVNIPDLEDSMKLDSLSKQITVISKEFEKPHFRFHQKPGEFNYDYDFDIPAPPEPPEHFRQHNWREFSPERDMKLFSYDRKGVSLNDLLGDIPMDRVKSYVIKDKKDGKRIIIDISDVPFFENHDRVIIMREPSPRPDQEGRKRIEKKIIIDRDKKDKGDEEKDEE